MAGKGGERRTHAGEETCSVCLRGEGTLSSQPFALFFKKVFSFTITFELRLLSREVGLGRGHEEGFFPYPGLTPSSEHFCSWRGFAWKKAAKFLPMYKISHPCPAPRQSGLGVGAGNDKITVEKSSMGSALVSCFRDGPFSWCWAQLALTLLVGFCF